jgi:sugar phosphate isomerase/epimerase
VSVPEWDPVQCLEELVAIGYEGVEWRVIEDKGDRSKPTFWSGNRSSMTASEVKAQAATLKAKAREVGIEMPSLGAYIGCENLADVELHFQACVAIGAKNIRIGAGRYSPENGLYPVQMKALKARYAEVAKLAARYGVRAQIETHMGQLCPTVHKAMAILDGLDPAHVGIMWDPGNQIVEGSEQYRMAIEMAGPYLAEVHVKNMAWRPGEEKDGRTTWSVGAAPVSKGIVDWPAVLVALKATGYDGWLMFEDFSTDVPMRERVVGNLKWFRTLLG